MFSWGSFGCRIPHSLSALDQKYVGLIIHDLWWTLFVQLWSKRYWGFDIVPFVSRYHSFDGHDIPRCVFNLSGCNARMLHWYVVLSPNESFCSFAVYCPDTHCGTMFELLIWHSSGSLVWSLWQGKNSCHWFCPRRPVLLFVSTCTTCFWSHHIILSSSEWPSSRVVFHLPKIVEYV